MPAAVNTHTHTMPLYAFKNCCMHRQGYIKGVEPYHQNEVHGRADEYLVHALSWQSMQRALA